MIPAGTRMYITSSRPHNIYIQPDTTLIDEVMHVRYDVRIDGQTVIPRGAIIIGDWVTESIPSIAAQFQSKQIQYANIVKDIRADSEVIEAITEYNHGEVNNASHLRKTLDYISVANIRRRVINFQCKVRILTDYILNSVYLEIFTKELPIVLLEDFNVPMPLV